MLKSAYNAQRLPFMSRDFVKELALKIYLTAAHGINAGDKIKQRGLPRTIGANDGSDFAGLCGQVDFIQSHQPAEGLAQPSGLQYHRPAQGSVPLCLYLSRNRLKTSLSLTNKPSGMNIITNINMRPYMMIS